jgi:hypothetical protein
MHPSRPVFPPLQARNLEGRVFHLPQDLEGELNLLILAFDRWHQHLVDTWTPWLDHLLRHYPMLRGYELPIISQHLTLARPLIDGGMAAHIHDRAARARTLTVYTDRLRLERHLALNPRTIALLLVDQQGHILWREYGDYHEGKASELEAMLETEPLTSPHYRWA